MVWWWYFLRAEWPQSTWEHPASASIFMLTSPVWAPVTEGCPHCAPTVSFSLRHRPRSRKVGKTTTSAFFWLLYAAKSAGAWCIFQFAAISGLRDGILFSGENMIPRGNSLRRHPPYYRFYRHYGNSRASVGSDALLEGEILILRVCVSHPFFVCAKAIPM